MIIFCMASLDEGVEDESVTIDQAGHEPRSGLAGSGFPLNCVRHSQSLGGDPMYFNEARTTQSNLHSKQCIQAIHDNVQCDGSLMRQPQKKK